MGRVTELQNRLYDRLRHRKAFEAAANGDGGRAEGFDSLEGHKYCLLVTFRRSGEPVPTPVWFGLAGGNVYVHTEHDVGKVRRIRRDPRVRVAPCTVRGRPLGPLCDGVARILDDGERDRAEQAIRSNYGLGRRLYYRFGGSAAPDTVYIEIRPAGEGEEQTA